ncbi:MAG: hypothetical protein JW940_18230 [Polyangiaceae bacterium]|nr:hypothetical protein [Polyangiaceae bacterium]
MRQPHLVKTCVFFAALVVGCQSSTDRPAEAAKTREGTASQRNNSNEESTRPEQAAEDFTYAQREEFVEDMQGALAHIQNEVDRLSGDVATAHGVAKAEAEAKVRSLREKAIRVKQQLEEAKSTSEATWDDVKGSIQESFGELEDSFQQTRQWVSDQLGS